MRRAFLPLAFAAFGLFPGGLPAQQKLTASNFTDFLAGYEANIRPLEILYKQWTREDLPLRDDEDQRLSRRLTVDRGQTLSDLRRTARHVAANPQDLVLTATLVIRTEALADELFELSRIAYDHDREDLGAELAAFQVTMDRNKELLADYLLTLAAEKDERLRQLEREKEDLQHKLKEAEKRSGPTPGHLK